MPDSCKQARKILRRNSQTIFLTCLAFAGPLLAHLRHPSFGFVLIGPSSKVSLVIQFAASVWGIPPEMLPLRPCRTAYDIEEIWARHAGGFLAIDDHASTTGNSHSHSDAAGIIAQMRQGIRKDQKAHAARIPRPGLTFLLSSPGLSRPGRTAWYETAHEKGGIFALPLNRDFGAHAEKTMKALLQGQALTTTGSSAPPIARYLQMLNWELAQPGNDLILQLRDAIRQFRDIVGAETLGASIQHAIDCFAVAYAAGLLVRRYGLFPISRGRILNAAVDCFRAHRAFIESADGYPDPVEALRQYIETNRARFKDARSRPLVISRRRFRGAKGFRHRSSAGAGRFSFSATRFRRIFGGNAAARRAAQILRARGLLVADRDLLQTKVQLRAGSGRDRVYCVRARILTL